ncbi:hypothetical protein [Streptomyces sp. NPDC048392]|uniref:hypothetical protein n=1 Tax=Streptomyces sp. NPDC048392 TaxID=3365543 RepID=UPI00371CD656
MVQLSWPSPGYNSRAVNDSEYEALSARFADDGIDGRPSDPAVVTAGAGLSVNVRADVYGNVRGRAWSSGSTTVNLPVEANVSGSTRIDRIVLRLDRSAWTVRAVVKAGTPGAGAPALSQTLGETGVYEVPVARATVLAGAAAVSVTREELYIGTRFRPCTSSSRNPIPVVGEFGVETDTGRVIKWNGASWVVIFGEPGEITVNASVSGWTPTFDSTLEYDANTVHLRLGTFTRTGGSLSAATDSRLPVLIPASYRNPNRLVRTLAYITGASPGVLTIYAANDAQRPGQVWLTSHPALVQGNVVIPGQVSWGRGR